MDRELRIIKDGYLFAEVAFSYDSQTSGTADIAIYQSIKIEFPDIKPVVPLFKFKLPFSHEEMNSIEAVKLFDLTYLQQLNINEIQFDGIAEFLYEPVNYRYQTNPYGPEGVANIDVDFLENKKELQFTSARAKRLDYSLLSDSLECNINLLKRFAEYKTDNYTY